MKEKLDETINRMTLEQKVGQLIIGQAEGFEMTEDFKEYILKYPLCGYRVNGENIKTREQVRSFMDSIQEAYGAAVPGCEAVLAADQEGGTLSVFGKLVSEFPGNMALGAAGDPGLAYLQGNATGYELSDLGINLAFAPVADVNMQVSNPVIGVRSFGDNPRKVAGFCVKLAGGLNKGGTAACGKHFPGHGNTNTDSHLFLPVNDVDFETLSGTELIPFNALIDAGIDSIMVSHVLYPKITGGNLPASLSEKIIGGILRGQLGYEGIIMTDDLEMKAIVDNYSIRQAVRMFIKAGGDIALINGTRRAQIEAFESIMGAVSSFEISIGRIDRSVRRVLKLKEKIQNYRQDRVSVVANPVLLSEEISRRAVTSVHNPESILPMSSSNSIILIVPRQIKLTEADTSDLNENNLYTFVKQHAPNARLLEIDLDSEPDIRSIVDLAGNYDTIVHCTINCLRFPWQVKLMEQLKEVRPLLVVMLRDPYDAMVIPQDVPLIASYSAIDPAMKAVGDLLFGKYEFSGKLPVSIPDTLNLR